MAVNRQTKYKSTDTLPTPLTLHLIAGAGDKYLVESQFIEVTDLTEAQIAEYDALADTDANKLSLQYKLAKLQGSATNFAADTDIDDLFAACPKVELKVVISNTANAANKVVYDALLAKKFTEGDNTYTDATGIEIYDGTTKLTYNGDVSFLAKCVIEDLTSENKDAIRLGSWKNDDELTYDNIYLESDGTLVEHL